MKVLLVDADSQKGFPNRALMCLSAWHKAKHPPDTIDLIKGIPSTMPLMRYDKIYVSTIFSQNRENVNKFLMQRRYGTDIEIGGSGSSYIKKELPYRIEHMMPDYDIYNIDFSLGFTSRGCIRKCGFCIVHDKEGAIHDHAPIQEFLHPDHKKVVLLDNNFQASPRWRENLWHIIDNRFQVNFNQGLDIRLMTREFAEMLKKTRYSTWKFNAKRFSIAFDSLCYEKEFHRGMKSLLDAKITRSTIMVYVLVGYNTTIQEDMYRVRKIREYGADPYIMRYNNDAGPNGILKHYARYINWRVFKKVPNFEDYDYSNAQEVIQACGLNGVIEDIPMPIKRSEVQEHD